MNKYMNNIDINNLYTEIKSLDSTSIFNYLTIIFISLAIFKNMNIELNTILALLIAIFVIIYYHQKNKIEAQTDTELTNKKKDNIQPELSKNAEEHDDIIDFLFSIQDFYQYNPQAFEEMIDNINSFFKVYKEVNYGLNNYSQSYKIAESKMHNSVNNLHSIVYKIPNSPQILNKLNKATDKLYYLLYNYLDDIHEKHNENIIRNGYNVNTNIINHTGPKEFNFYLQDKSHIFDYY